MYQLSRLLGYGTLLLYSLLLLTKRKEMDISYDTHFILGKHLCVLRKRLEKMEKQLDHTSSVPRLFSTCGPCFRRAEEIQREMDFFRRKIIDIEVDIHLEKFRKPAIRPFFDGDFSEFIHRDPPRQESRMKKAFRRVLTRLK